MDNFEPVTEDEYRRLMGILMENANKTFVQRIISPDRFPTLDAGNGAVATHRMAWNEAGGRYFVYPTVLYDGKGLKDYGDAAWDQAVKSGNFIEFKTPQDAEWFSKRYKGAWGGEMNKPPR